MKKYNYNWEVKNLVTLFVNALNDIIVKRYNDNKEVEDQIHVDFKYSPKTRTLFDLVQKNQHIKLPVISCYISGIRRDQNRVFNNIEGSYWSQHPAISGFEHLYQPLPVDITMGLSVIARYQTDIDQIIDNIFVWFDPYIVVSCEVPNFSQEMRAAIFWSENIGMEYPTDIDGSKPYRVIANTTFDIKGWLYKPPASPVGKIYKIDTSFIAVSDIYVNSYQSMVNQKRDNTVDLFTISARPFVTSVVPYMEPIALQQQFAIYGNMMQYTCGIYVSASNDNMFPFSMYSSALSTNTWGITYVDIFGGDRKLSAYYPPFSGANIESWYNDGEHTLIATIPSAANAGFFDIIVWNEAGYGKLTVDSFRHTTNPYVSTLPEYLTWVPYQPPYISGVQVVNI